MRVKKRSICAFVDTYSPKSQRNINVLRTCRTEEHFLVLEKGQKVQCRKVSSLSTLTYSKVANVTYV